MTLEQAQTLARFAREAMKKSSDAQQTVLQKAILALPEDVVADALVEFAAESEFISTQAILAKVKAKMGGGAYDRWKAAAVSADMKFEALKVTEHPTITQAIEFCNRLAPAQLAAWRAEVEAASPFLARQWAGKPLNTAIAAVIYSKFGRIPRECWKGAVA